MVKDVNKHLHWKGWGGEGLGRGRWGLGKGRVGEGKVGVR